MELLKHKDEGFVLRNEDGAYFEIGGRWDKDNPILNPRVALFETAASAREVKEVNDFDNDVKVIRYKATFEELEVM